MPGQGLGRTLGVLMGIGDVDMQLLRQQMLLQRKNNLIDSKPFMGLASSYSTVVEHSDNGTLRATTSGLH